MAVYAIGDIQGCFDDLLALLEKIKFDPGSDQLWFCGDLVNRGPKSLETLRFVKGLGASAVTVLGNHDLHLLAVHEGYGKVLTQDTFQPILNADDRDELMTWLRHQPLFHYDERLAYAMVHAGLIPQWNLVMAMACAAELEAVLRGPDYMAFIVAMYGNKPNRWSDDLVGIERLRLIANVFTRLRFCENDGRLNLKEKGGFGSQPAGLLPWFEISGRNSCEVKVVFGHWSTIGIGERQNTWALDGGCLWGGTLVALRLDVDQPRWFSVKCDAACVFV